MNKVIKDITETIIYSNVWISAGAVSFALTSSIILQYKVNYLFILFIFSTTLFTYNFQRLVKIYNSTLQPISGPRAVWMKKNIILVYILTSFSLVGGIIAGWTFFSAYFWLFIIVGFFSFFYVWKLPVFRANIRSIPGLKIFILAITWVLATQIIPFLMFSTSEFTFKAILVFFSFFLFMISISIPFDIRDIEIDNKNLKTIPQLLGIKESKWFSLIMLIAGTIIISWFSEEVYYGIVINTILTGIIIYNSEMKRKELFYSGLVDGTLILQFILLYLLK